MSRIQNIKGQKFGRLTVLEYMYTEKGKSSTWMCQCECGKTVPVSTTSLKNGNTQSCGCLRLERVKEKVTTHSKSYTAEYHAWGNMIQRCTNPRHPEYKNYGARGITVCPEWQNSFESFLKDMGLKPNKSYSIDRINNEDGYHKENCRWADNFTQAANQRDKENRTTGIKSISYSKRDNLYYVGVERKGQRYRKAFKVLEEAIEWKESVLKKHEEID